MKLGLTLLLLMLCAACGGGEQLANQTTIKVAAVEKAFRNPAGLVRQADIRKPLPEGIRMAWGFFPRSDPASTTASVVVASSSAVARRISLDDLSGKTVHASFCVSCRTLRVRNVLLVFGRSTSPQVPALEDRLATLGHPVSP